MLVFLILLLVLLGGGGGGGGGEEEEEQQQQQQQQLPSKHFSISIESKLCLFLWFLLLVAGWVLMRAFSAS